MKIRNKQELICWIDELYIFVGGDGILLKYTNPKNPGMS